MHCTEPASRRYEYPTRSLDGLNIKCCYALCAQLFDLGTKRCNRCIDDCLRIRAHRISISIMRWNFMLPVIRHTKARMKYWKSCQTGTRSRRAVITIFHRNELVFLRGALGMIVIANETDCTIDRIGTAKREIDVIKITRRTICEFSGQTNGRF